MSSAAPAVCAGPFTQVVARHNVGLRRHRIGMDRLLVRKGDNRQQNYDRHRNRQRQSQRARAANASTIKISSVAYAVDDKASDAKTASPTALPIV